MDTSFFYTFLRALSEDYLHTLCEEIPERTVGSRGNYLAAHVFARAMVGRGWEVVETPKLNVFDWKEQGAELRAGGDSFAVFVSPYSLGCDVQAELIGIATLQDLEKANLTGKIVLLYGEIAAEPLAPKNFVFYNPETHQRILALLEAGQPAAIVSATGRNSAVAGGVYPFPLIEDGDFNIPSVYMTAEEGQRLLPYCGSCISLESRSERLPAKAFNIIAHQGDNPQGRIVITAHIDAKRGTPGAIDNATGLVVLILLADLLFEEKPSRRVELIAFNGEDHYAVPGQMAYLRENEGRFGEILLNINIDGAGYKDGPSAFSLMGLPQDLHEQVSRVLQDYDGIVEGPPWYQGDHSIFLQQGCPAIAVSSLWLLEHMENQDITHTPKDNPRIVDCNKLIEIARALNQLVRAIW
ncbi:MAG: M28 family peptidase [Anaerolinea sp.]|nr:M28 family peptidase [Anaerolinea sp.]